MKKLLSLAIGIMVSAMTSYALPYMCIYTTTGGDTPEAVVSDGLVMTVDGDNFVATPQEGSALVIPLNTLVGMQFSWNSTEVISILGNSSDSFELYGLDGVKAGSFTSLDEAAAVLTPGLYVMKNETGKSVKILLGK